MRLIVARCDVDYTGRLSAVLPEALRLLMIKSDGSVMVHADTGGYKPQNWMTPPTVIEEDEDRIVVRKRAGATEDRLEIRIVEVLSDVTHDMGEAADLEKDGVERHLQELLADAPRCCGEGFRLVRREWPTDIGPVTSCAATTTTSGRSRDQAGRQRSTRSSSSRRYLERIRQRSGDGELPRRARGSAVKPQARVLAESRGIECVEIDLAVCAASASRT